MTAGRAAQQHQFSPGLSGGRRHATEAEYRRWVDAHVPHPALRYQQVGAYRSFVRTWPDLEAWFAAPLLERLELADTSNTRNDRAPRHRGKHYLVYLSLVRGVGLDFDVLLGRKYPELFSAAAGGSGYGVNPDLFDRWVNRLAELGYSRTRAHSHLTWATRRLLLYRGDPDLTAITADDLFALSAAVREFAARDDFAELRQALYPNKSLKQQGFHGNLRERFTHAHLAKIHAMHTLLFHVGQVEESPRRGTKQHTTWRDQLLPEACPPRIRHVVERYLRLRLDANLDRPQTVRLTREALRRFLNWLGTHHSTITNLAELNRRVVEQYLKWLPTYVSPMTGKPLVTTTRKHEINALAGFFRDTAVWEWYDVPGRPLLTQRDSPRLPDSVPRYLPEHELAGVMAAVDALDDPLQRAALLVLRWSGARRDEVRRLTCDCLDAYPGGHPRLRIPLGKGHSERVIPLHPDAADALQHAIELARAQNALPSRDSHSGRDADYVFIRKGKLVSSVTLFDKALRSACQTAGLVDARGVPTVSPHRFRHTLGTQLADGGARIQTIMAILGHKSANMAVIYSRITDPEVRRQYETALAAGRLAGPAAEPVLNGELDDNTVHWLQTNFLKTELELGHCLRLPAEGPCECDIMLTCPKFLTTDEYVPRLRARLDTERALISDANDRGWPREVERHEATTRRLTQLLDELEQSA